MSDSVKIPTPSNSNCIKLYTKIGADSAKVDALCQKLTQMTGKPVILDSIEKIKTSGHAS